MFDFLNNDQNQSQVQTCEHEFINCGSELTRQCIKCFEVQNLDAESSEWVSLHPEIKEMLVNVKSEKEPEA